MFRQVGAAFRAARHGGHGGDLRGLMPRVERRLGPGNGEGDVGWAHREVSESFDIGEKDKL